MSIANEITRLQGGKANLKTSLNAKNDAEHQITDETIDEYYLFADSITSGGNTILDVGDENVSVSGTTLVIGIYYTELEYIESTGIQYIDTGYIFDNDTEMQGEFQYTSIKNSNTTIFGMHDGTASTGTALIEVNTNKPITMYVPIANTISITRDLNKHTFTMQGYNLGGLLQIDNTTGTAGQITQSKARNIHLFKSNTQNSSDYNWASGRIFSFKMFRGGTLVRDFMPARKMPANVIGMYDKVTEQFFTNQGSGDFIAGPEI